VVGVGGVGVDTGVAVGRGVGTGVGVGVAVGDGRVGGGVGSGLVGSGVAVERAAGLTSGVTGDANAHTARKARPSNPTATTTIISWRKAA
jgi:hypothetical protein